jgi:hypothetical protein
MSRGLGRYPIPRQNQKAENQSLCRPARAAHIARAARYVNHENVSMKPIAGQRGAISQGELYEYDERPGMLNVHLRHFRPVDRPPVTWY